VEIQQEEIAHHSAYLQVEIAYVLTKYFELVAEQPVAIKPVIRPYLQGDTYKNKYK
jgi:hypothetical protein